MKTIEYEFDGKTYYLCMNGKALFDCYEKFGTEVDITDNIKDMTPKSFENICWLLSKLSEQGELVRRYEGFDKGEMLGFGESFLHLDPLGIVKAREAIYKALALGFTRTVESEEKEIDVGLEELEQKKKVKSRRRNGFIRLHRFWAYLSKKVFCSHRA